ncbi:DNA-3-methyladenine glycosylase 2 family protein [Aphanothece hegewaldii CCALA 016]|uniref:DNA-3-methyladenine glycosylase II n=1 Tax=Aphanothece hegewaldii CCALA 016 TaxID=2107694 RepID=A0A2T1LWY6_9CHRO|nr:DNA-3-methyladenine glycosylase [Aphanothece hegewaldii]PSF36574.1 DNA-3-methyladenine glycosylase 2 family protein [Aphanothece hegewaldii CCALA 016]
MQYKEAILYLQETDPKLSQLINKVGECHFASATPQTNLLSALVWAIIAQQISTVAANKIYQRFLIHYTQEEPLQVTTLLQATDEDLRSIGISRFKIRYLRNLAQFISSNGSIFDNLENLDDQTVIQSLSEIKGIGQWTAQMILIFWLQRLDVLPSGDLGIRRAIQHLYELEKIPSPEAVTKIGEKWKPYRTIASWYLWRSLSDSILGINL